MCLQEAKDVPAVVEMLSKAKSILGYDLLDLCLNGPKEKLDDTAFAQPALFVAGLAAVEKLRKESPETVRDCSMCAGLSLGEYCALAFAGVITFEEGLKVEFAIFDIPRHSHQEGCAHHLKVLSTYCCEIAAAAIWKIGNGGPLEDWPKNVWTGISNDKNDQL